MNSFKIHNRINKFKPFLLNIAINPSVDLIDHATSSEKNCIFFYLREFFKGSFSISSSIHKVIKMSFFVVTNSNVSKSNLLLRQPKVKSVFFLLQKLARKKAFQRILSEWEENNFKNKENHKALLRDLLSISSLIFDPLLQKMTNEGVEGVEELGMFNHYLNTHCSHFVIQLSGNSSLKHNKQFLFFFSSH